MSDIIERAETYMSYEHPRVGANRLVPQEIVKELVAELKAARTTPTQRGVTGIINQTQQRRDMDAADELSAMILERLDVLSEINKSTFNSAHPTNCGPVQRWIEDVRGKVTRFNLKAIKCADNPLLPKS